MNTPRRSHKLLTLIAIVLFVFTTSCKDKEIQSGNNSMEEGFVNIPDSVQTSVYWYWISDNISKEGVIKDLQAMKKAGINRAFMGNIGIDNLPRGKVKMFSDEWWEILHAALKTASELNIEIGIFNSPGWSQSGGPWVKPEEAMRYLAFSETIVEGPSDKPVKLVHPGELFQDVKVIAYPVTGNETDLCTPNCEIGSTPSVAGIQSIADGDESTAVALPHVDTLKINIKAKDESTVRSISVKPADNTSLSMDVDVFVLNGNAYQHIKAFHVNRTNPSLQVGFNPYAPVVIALPDTKGTEFRIVCSNISPNSRIAEIRLSSIPLTERYIEKTLAKMHQTPLPYWKDYLWDPQPEIPAEMAINPSSVVDISQYLSPEGILKWDVPAGKWKIIRAGMLPTGVTNSPAPPEGTGYETDKMSKKHIQSHFDAYLGEIIRRIPAEDRRTWKVVVADSYETGGQNWTDDFIERFKHQYGYDPVPFIPVFNGSVVGNRDISDRFLWDLRRLVADGIAYDYVGGLREIAHKHGLRTWLENYGHWGFPGEFLQYGGQSDEVSGEFWSIGELGDIENRAASSSAHIYGKKKVSAESFTSAGPAYSRYPAEMKKRGDRFFAEGINNTLLHVFIEQAYEDKVPGVNAWFGNEFDRNNTWFSQLDLFTTYLKRCNFMLQQGNYVADVAYFIGEDAPKMTGICDPSLPKGYSFDYINAEVIMNRLKVKDGYMVLPDGLQYKVLVLPKLETMRPELLSKISQMVKEGAVVLGPAPQRSPSYQHYPDADKEVVSLAGQLWGNVDGIKVKQAQVGKGMILSGMTLEEVFGLLQIKPDLESGNNDPVQFIHRTTDEGDFYFLTNQSDTVISITPQFRITGRMPELWNALDGSIRILPGYGQENNRTMVPLRLDAHGSAFIVFRKPASGNAVPDINKNFPAEENLLNIDGPWNVAFDPSGRGPQQPVIMHKLEDWSASANDSIRYYSGTAIYTTKVNITGIPSGKSIYLHLGAVSVMAKVKVNGVYAGGVWTAPWRVDISKQIREGENDIEIEVVNTWVNRLIGDSKLPPEQRKTWLFVNPYTPESKLQSSGLTGPVTIAAIQYPNK